MVKLFNPFNAFVPAATKIDLLFFSLKLTLQLLLLILLLLLLLL